MTILVRRFQASPGGDVCTVCTWMCCRTRRGGEALMGETGDCFPGSIRLTNTPSHQRCLSVCMYASVCVFVCVCAFHVYVSVFVQLCASLRIKCWHTQAERAQGWEAHSSHLKPHTAHSSHNVPPSQMIKTKVYFARLSSQIGMLIKALTVIFLLIVHVAHCH